ncbi:MAG: tRNA pseudouridine(55) synthase TruB, partial [Candidatus Levybacteria bacterium CG_4_10_14_0_2_um_filter_36_16]
MDGIFAVNKPLGMTSHDVVDLVRKKTGVKRVGHGGTLDPLASGVLVIAVGRENTKRLNEFVKGEKEYVAEIKLG